jgi:hypothetical protein
MPKQIGLSGRRRLLLARLLLVCVFACVCLAARLGRNLRCRRKRSQLVCLLKRSQTPATARRRRGNDAAATRRRRGGDARSLLLWLFIEAVANAGDRAATTRKRRGGDAAATRRAAHWFAAMISGIATQLTSPRSTSTCVAPAAQLVGGGDCGLSPSVGGSATRPATGDVAPPTCKTQHATGEMRRVSCKMQHASATDGRGVAARRARKRTATIKRANKQTNKQASNRRGESSGNSLQAGTTG